MAEGSGEGTPVAAPAVTSLALAYADLQLAVRGYLGEEFAAVDVDDIIKAGYRWFLSGEYPDPRRPKVLLYWQWSFLYPWASLTIWPTTQTAAATIWGTTTTGAATISGVGNLILTVDDDTFFENMVGETIVSDTLGTSYTIAGYTSAKVITLSADASADDGDTFTITAAGTNIWVDEDTFYPGMVGHKIVSDTLGTEYTITAYTDSENITVDSSAVADHGDTFTITADGIYQLPAAYGDMHDPFTYAEGTGLGPILEVAEARIRQARAGATTTADPYWFAVLPRAAYSGYVLETAGTFYDVVFWPTPSALRVLTYRYKILVSALDGTVCNYPLGGQEFAQVVLQCCLAKAEQMKRFTIGPQTALAREDMLAAVRRDAVKGAGKRLGKMVDASGALPVRRWPATSDVTHPW